MSPRVRRTNKRKNKALSFTQLLVLFCGFRDPNKYPLIARDQFGYLTLDAAKKAWEENKDSSRVCPWLDSDSEDFRAGWRPWAWWAFEAPEPRDRELTQEAQLRRLGVLTEAELAELNRPKFLLDNSLPAALVDYDLLPLDEAEPFSPEVIELIDRAVEKAKGETWFKYVCTPGGRLSPADADAILNHGCWFDTERAYHAVDFIEAFCKNSQGSLFAGKFIELTEWQKHDFLMPLFGWVRPDGTRRFRECYLQIAKKQGKSTICSAIQTYCAVAEGEGGPRVYTAATAKDQANIVYKEAEKMVKASPELSRILFPVPSAKEIKRDDDYVIKALAADAATSEGLNAYLLVIDEKHAWKGEAMTKFYGSIRYSMIARVQPLTISITTAGDDQDTLCGRDYKRAKLIITGQLFSFDFLAVVYEPDPKLNMEDPRVYFNPAIWKQANPSLGVIMTLESFYTDLLKALGTPNDWADFQRYRLNVWVGGLKPWMPMGAWFNCNNPKFEEAEMHKQLCYSGLDLSAIEDLTALVHCFPRTIEIQNKPITKYRFIWRFWCPEETIEAKLQAGEDKYRVWADKGLIYSQPGAVIDHDEIYTKLAEDYLLFRIRELAYDEWGADQLALKLRMKGLRVVPFRQNYKEFSPPTKEFKMLLQNGHIEHGGNPVAEWMARQVAVTTDRKDNIMPVKNEKNIRFKIDGIVAGIMGLDRALRHGQNPGSQYNTKAVM